MQTIARGEARTVIASVMLLTGPDDRTFAFRVGKRGQVERVEGTMTPGTPETVGDQIRVLLTGTLTAAGSALLSKGVVDLTVFATNPIARLVRAQVAVEDEIGEGGVL